MRPANNKDIPAIKIVVFTALQEFGLPYGDSSKDADLNDIEKNYLEDGGYFGVVENSMGFIIGTIGLCAQDNHTCELRKNYLNKNYRGQGLGKWMLAVAIQIAIEKGFQKIFLETISPLKAAIMMYQRFGFVEVPIKEISARVDQAFELDLKNYKSQ